ncbi:MAG TPA: anhydro-N-acetylmuramic acid kinase [Ferruginibacter sp.]|nr:anhydro-N-acetylmuramic acid kinase [Ferruginibacter sp.]HMP21824.1 anhydro-N-acetylmuramic acid kinase [Ferruginibacter sp.]
MIYRAIGTMSGSSLDGLDIAYILFEESGGKWQYDILAADCIAYDYTLQQQLSTAAQLTALQYQLLHTAYGQYTGRLVNDFINRYQLQHKVNLLASHGHTVFHAPQQQMTAQLGEGAAIAAVTGLPVVSDLRAMDIALGGQGAPIVPIGEKMLFPQYAAFLNIGGIANITCKKNDEHIAFDVCPANRVLNLLAAGAGVDYDKDGAIAASGSSSETLLHQLESQEYYGMPYPKSLANSFGTDVIYPLIMHAGISTADALHTYTVHIARQVAAAVAENIAAGSNKQLLVSGGGAFNTFLITQLSALLLQKDITVVIPDAKTVQYKEALIMALLGVLRWREEATTIPSVTGASRPGIGGALWLGA